MQSLTSLLTKTVDELGGEPAKFNAVANNNAAYKSAIQKVWSDQVSSQLILQHTNAFYVRLDERPKKGADKNRDYYIGEVVIDDPVVRSEIDTHRELIFCHLKVSGINIDELKIIPAKGNMRKRHPFA